MNVEIGRTFSFLVPPPAPFHFCREQRGITWCILDSEDGAELADRETRLGSDVEARVLAQSRYPNCLFILSTTQHLTGSGPDNAVCIGICAPSTAQSNPDETRATVKGLIIPVVDRSDPRTKHVGCIPFQPQTWASLWDYLPRGS